MSKNMLDFVKAEVRRVSLDDLPKVANSTGVSLSGIRKIRYDEVTDPRYSTVHALARYFERRRLAGRKAA
jgi:predicted transcriptional regulator